jgi:hypothetical protein
MAKRTSKTDKTTASEKETPKQPAKKSTVKKSTAKAKAKPKASPAKKPKAPAAVPTQDEIAARAYDLYLQRGRAPGDPVADWLQAEGELKAERE